MTNFKFNTANDDTYMVVASSYENAVKIAMYHHRHGSFWKVDDEKPESFAEWGGDVYYETDPEESGVFDSDMWDEEDPTPWEEVIKW